MYTAAYPSYRIDAFGPDDTGISMVIQVEVGAGGPLAGLTPDSLLAEIRALVSGQPDVTSQMSYSTVTTTSF